MHELLVTRSMLDTALGTARQHEARRILAIDVVVGDLSSIVDDSVQFYFDFMAHGTAADGALLRFRREPAVALCADCGVSHPVTPPLPHECQACGSWSIRVTGGQEFYIESIEVDS